MSKGQKAPLKIYFMASIRGGRSEEDRERYQAIVDLLSQYGEVLNKHIAKLSSAGENVNVYSRDKGWILESRACIGELTNESTGIGYEIFLAKFYKKPFLGLLYKKRREELDPVISGNKNLDTREYSTVEELKSIFDAFFKKIRPIPSK